MVDPPAQCFFLKLALLAPLWACFTTLFICCIAFALRLARCQRGYIEGEKRNGSEEHRLLRFFLLSGK